MLVAANTAVILGATYARWQYIYIRRDVPYATHTSSTFMHRTRWLGHLNSRRLNCDQNDSILMWCAVLCNISKYCHTATQLKL